MDSESTSLREWHIQYTAHDDGDLTKDSKAIKALESDNLDMESFEPWIHAVMQGSQVDKGFCGPCHYLLDNWPSFKDYKERLTWEDGKRVYKEPKPAIGRQDDENDWQKEAELMQLVYSGSYINIAASSATDVYQECFLKPPTFCDGFCTKLVKDGIPTNLEFTDQDDVYGRTIMKSLLMTRAWAIQEKMLPPRTIHIGDRGVFWDCRAGFGSEYLPRLTTSYASRGLGRGLLGERDYVKSPVFWSKIVRIYSSANLTYRNDKLRALAGMARAVFENTGDDYLSGMWRADIEVHLCWNTIGPRVTRKRPDRQDPDWTAPSWSWASIDGSVSHGDWPQNKKLYCHVFDTGLIAPKGQDFGKVSREVLHLRCSTLLAGHFIEWPILPLEESCVPSYVVIGSNNGGFVVPIHLDCTNDFSGLPNEVMYLLPIYQDEIPILDSEYADGIVLRKTAGAAGEYCRIGSFDLSLETEIVPCCDSPRQTFKEVINDVGAATAMAGCAEVVTNSEHPSEKYVITIV